MGVGHYITPDCVGGPGSLVLDSLEGDIRVEGQ